MAGIDSVNVKELQLDVIGTRDSLKISSQTLGIIYQESDKAIFDKNTNIVALYQERDRITAEMPLYYNVLCVERDSLSMTPGDLDLVVLTTSKKNTVDFEYASRRIVDNSPIKEGSTTTSQGTTAYNPGNATAFSVPSKDGYYKLNTSSAYSKHGQAVSFKDNPSFNLGENVTEVFLSCNVYMPTKGSFGIYAGTIDQKHGLTVTDGEISGAPLYKTSFPCGSIVPVKIHWSSDKRRYDELNINGILTININGQTLIQKDNTDVSAVSLSNIVFKGDYDKVWLSDILVTTENIAGREVYSNPDHLIGGKKKYDLVVNVSTRRHLAGNVNYNYSTQRRIIGVTATETNYDTRRVISEPIDSYYTILRHIYTSVDTEFSTVRALHDGKQTINDSFATLRKVVLDIPADYDTVRKLTGNVTANYDTRRSISGPVDLNWRMARIIENELFHICDSNFDTRREIYSKPTDTEGYYECKEIDLGYEYYIGAALEIKGTGYAQIRYAGNNHKYGEYEPYNPRFVTCRYIQVRLVVRGIIEKAVATIVSPEQEINVTKDIPKEGATVSYGTRFYTVPSIFPSYSDKKVVVSNITTTSCFVKLTDDKGNAIEGSVSLLVRG